ncbi:tRNA (mo5U34)-methyltransferase [Salmonella enterica]|nr:tRNA (mo5U34)-methyltransferase [Salmonella enterica]
MIEFGNCYKIIAKNDLAHWLETLPEQLAAWQREQQHGLFKQWSNAVECLPEITPWRLDLLHSIATDSEAPLSEGQLKRIDTWLRMLMP